MIARSLDLTIDEIMNFTLELSEKEIKKLVENAVDNYVEKGFETGQNYVKEILKNNQIAFFNLIHAILACIFLTYRKQIKHLTNSNYFVNI